MYHHFGLDDNDIEKIRQLDGTFKVYGAKSKDIIIQNHNSNSIVRINEIRDDCNKLVIKEGRKPENKNEMLIEYGINDLQNIHVGDTIKIDEELIKIVGSALSTDFLIKNKMINTRGTSNVGSGRVSFCLFALNDYFDFEHYTTAYIVDEKIKDLKVDSDEYKDILRKDKEALNTVKEELEKEKYQRIIDEANNKINEEETKVNSEIQNAKNELDNAKSELDSAKEELDNTKNVLDFSKKEIDNAETKIKEYQKKLNSAKTELDAGKEKLDDTKNTLDNSKNDLDKSEKELNSYEQKLISSKNELDSQKSKIDTEIGQYNISYQD